MPGIMKENKNEKSFRALFDNYKNRLYGYVLTMTRSEYAAEEITQEIFIKLWLCHDILDHIENIDGYLFKIARNKTLNYLRKAGNNEKLLRELQGSMNVCNNDAEERVILHEYDQLLQDALNRLSPQRRLVYQLSRHQGMTIDEIACHLHLSPNTAKNHLVEALRLIRISLGNHISAVALMTLFLVN